MGRRQFGLEGGKSIKFCREKQESNRKSIQNATVNTGQAGY